MDDTRTQQALDQLADLFLTGKGPVAIDTPADSPDEVLNGPAPIKLSPKLVGPAKPLSPAPRIPSPPKAEKEPPLSITPELDGSPIASIGESPQPLYLQTEDLPQEDAPSRQVAVEAVLLGNLPGLSGPWLTQYAQLLAQQEGPVAILHVDDDAIDLELVEPTDRDLTDRGVSLRMPPGGGVLDVVSVLNSLLDSPGASPSTVLVHLDPQNDKRGLSRALAIEDWTLMCGADDAAVVSGYWMLKTMVDQDPAVASKRVGLMVMGSDPKESQDAARKVQSAAESFLHTPVQLLGWQKQMVPVNLRHLGRFEDVGSAWPALAGWLDRHAATGPDEIEEIEIPAQEAAVQAQPVTEAQSPQAEPAVVPPIAEEVVTSTPKRSKVSELFTDPPQITAPPKRMDPPPAPKPKPEIQTQPVGRDIITPPAPTPAPVAEVTTEPARVASPTSDEPDLVELLMTGTAAVPGGIALEARCPLQPKTQLLLSQDGQLHLLRRHAPGSPASPGSPSDGAEGLGPAMVDLLQARKWVVQHLQLIQLTQRQCRFDADCDPVLHLFTDRADWATALITRLGDSLKLHLLQDIELAGERAWFCTPLN